MLRAVAEGKVGWAFWPPGTDTEHVVTEGAGIWVPKGENVEEEFDDESGDDEEQGKESGDSSEDELPSGTSDEDEEEEQGGATTGGMFEALSMENLDEEDE